MRISTGKRRSPILLLSGAITVIILFAGCGGGGGSSQGTIKTAKPASKEQLLRAIEGTLGALEQEMDRGKALEKITIANQLATLGEYNGIQLIPDSALDECLTVVSRNETINLIFDGTAKCNGFSGTLEVTPNDGNDPDRNFFRNTIKQIDFSTGDGCPVSGVVRSDLSVQGNRFTDDCTYTDMDICGQQLSGKVVFVGEKWETDLAILNARGYIFDNGVNVEVDVDWHIDTSELSGSADSTIDNISLSVTVNQIIFHDTCSLPVGGTLTIKDPEGGNTVAHFSNTDCETPEASVDYEGTIETWPLTLRKEDEIEIEPIVAGVKIIGEEEIVFDWSEDSCEIEDIPDSKACAFRDKDGDIQLISTHFINRRMIGNNLSSMKINCNIIMDSHYDPDPSKFNEHEWITSTYTLDGKTIYALIHNEYQGWEIPGKCPLGEKNSCLYNSISSAISTDGGATYQHVRAPNHLVATLPYQYIPDKSPIGVLGVSNIIFNKHDRWFYVQFHIDEYGIQKKGVCVMRTKNLADPQSWRAWDGRGYNVRFANPYINNNVNPANHICEPVSYENINTNCGYVTYNSYFEKYLLVSAGLAWDSDRKEAVSGFYFSLSDDLINWGPLQLIMEAELWYTAGLEVDRYAYPSLIDPSDTSRNFSTTGKNPYLYFVRRNKNVENIHIQNYNRDLIRMQLEFSKN